MHRINTPTATSDNRFTEGDPTIPIQPTVVSAEWLNAVQEELASVITGAGLTLDAANNAQVLAAIQQLISVKTTLATIAKAGLVKPDGITIQIDATGTLSLVGRPASGLKVAGEAVLGLFTRSPDNNHMLANGDLALFVDRPALKASYEAGILAVADAVSSSWGGFVAHKSGAVVDGLYMPNTNSLFMQMVTSGAGGRNSAGLPDHSHTVSFDSALFTGNTYGGRAVPKDYNIQASLGNYKSSLASLNNEIYGNSTTVMPASIKHLACIYVGEPA